MKIRFCTNCNSEINVEPTEERSCCPDPNIIDCDYKEIRQYQKSEMRDGVEIIRNAKEYVKGGSFNYYA